jgi:Tol biopolymer transport system component
MGHKSGMRKPFAACLICLLYFALAPRGGTSAGRMESVSTSPDGKTIAVDFIKDKTSHIYLISIETTDATRLTNDNTGQESDLTFSPDGKHIAFTYFPRDGGPSRIILGNNDGSSLHEWAPSQDKVRDFSPVFSPDNKTMIFARSRYYGGYSPIAQPHHHAWDFYVADLDGTSIRQLTDENFYSASRLSVSPDGKSIVSVTESLDATELIAIYSLDHPAKPARVLRPRVPGHERIYNSPNFMPDGKSILFLAASNGRHGYDYDVYRLDLETEAIERLTKGNGYATDLRVFPDGKTVVFLKWRSDWHGTPVESDLYLLDLQSHKFNPLKTNGLN